MPLIDRVIASTPLSPRVCYPRGKQLNFIAFRMASTFTLPDSRSISYSLDQSPKDGPIVLLSNSLCNPYRGWDHIVKDINARGFRTLRYDQPGHGKSAAPKGLDTTFESMADDVNHLLKSLKIEKLHGWIGVSMGAAAGITFVTKYPNIVSKIAICDTISASPVNVGVDDVFATRVADARKAGDMKDTINGTMDRWFGKQWLEKNPEEAKRMHEVMSETTLDGFETCCNAIRSKTFDLRPLFTKVASGVDDALCVVGEKDANLPQTMEEMRAQIEKGFKDAGKDKKIDLVIIKDAGHVSFIDGHEQFSKDVVGWF